MNQTVAHYFVIAFPFTLGAICGAFAVLGLNKYAWRDEPKWEWGTALVALLVVIFYGALI